MADDLESLSAEDIAAEIDRRANEPEPVAAPEPEAEPETPEEPEAPAEPEPEPVEEPEAPDINAILEEVVLLRDQFAAEKERSKHFEMLMSRSANEVHRLRKTTERTSRPAEDEDYPEDTRERSRVPREVLDDLDELKREKVERGIASVDAALSQQGSALWNEHKAFWEPMGKQPEQIQAEFNAEWQRRFREEATGLGLSEARDVGDVKRATSIARVAYKTALAETRSAFRGRFSRSGDQTARLKEKKSAAAAGTSGARAASRPKGPQSLDEVPVDEIAAEITRRERINLVR